MNCYSRYDYNYFYIKYEDNIDELKEFCYPISVSELDNSAIIHLSDINKSNIIINKGQYLVITEELYNGVLNKHIYEVYNENDFMQKFEIEPINEEDTIIHIEKEGGEVVWIKRKTTPDEKKQYAYIERDEKDIPICYEEPYAIIEYRNNEFPVYCDDYGQQDFIVLGGEVMSGGAYNLLVDYDFIDMIDEYLNSLSKKDKYLKLVEKKDK